MKILEYIGKEYESDIEVSQEKKILAIDPSSLHIAFAVMHSSDRKLCLEAAGKVNFVKKSSKQERCEVIKSTLPILVEKYQPNVLLVEESIWIQNPLTSRTLAYIVGSLLQEGVHQGLQVDDASPLSWKAHIGYKNVTKKEQASWGLDEKETKKKASFERKHRVAKIIWHMFPDLEIEDTDILDAIGIAIYGLRKID